MKQQEGNEMELQGCAPADCSSDPDYGKYTNYSIIEGGCWKARKNLDRFDSW